MFHPKLTPMQRRVYDLFFVSGLRQVEIAALLKISQPAVSMRIGRIRRRYQMAGVRPPGNPGAALGFVKAVSFSELTNL